MNHIYNFIKKNEKVAKNWIYFILFFILLFSGSGGNNHAIDYYKETNYPLAVKLGTITPDGAGLCSYMFGPVFLMHLNAM